MTYIHTESVHNTKSAEEIVPIIMELLQPTSVVDVGCGIGTWLAVFKQYGVNEIIGIDGDYVNRKLLHISEDRFIAHDLSKPFSLNQQFDLAICLEVAEHLPEDAANILIKTLTSLGKSVLFSAAIPNQGGQHHINEKSPEYWKMKFSQHEYVLRDCIRSRIWSNPKVDWWYKQNLFLITPKNTSIVLERQAEDLLYIVHPDLYNWRVQQISKIDPDLVNEDLPYIPLSHALMILLKSLKNSFRF